MEPTPKQRFIKTQVLREALEKFVVTKEAEAARDATILEFINRQNRAAGVNQAWDEHSKLVGAQEALEIFFSLPFPETTQHRERLPNLKPPQ